MENLNDGSIPLLDGEKHMDTFCASNRGILEVQGLLSYSLGNTEIFVNGLIYAYGKKAGIETLKWIIEKLNKGEGVPFAYLRGAFSCIVKQENNLLAFSDNSNMHCIFYSNHYVSNSFLTIIDCEKKAGYALSPDIDSICEYFTIGNIYFGKTFFQTIHILSSDKVLALRDGVISIEDKNVGDIGNKSFINSFDEFFKNFSYSISNYKVCQALTGGYDSRLIYVCVSEFIDDHIAISGSNDSSPDIKYARKVAEANNATLQVIDMDKPALQLDLIDQIMLNNDGIQPFDLDADLRLLEFKRELSNDYDLHLTGDGGVLHKDWEWSQDIPFYKKKKSDSKRFYRQRLYHINIDNHIGESLKESFSKQEERFVKELNKISKSINTQSYDSWYYQVSGNRRVYYNNNPCPGIISYAPLMEQDIVRYSYSLSRFKRFFYNSMRDVMTSKNVKVARIKTNYGTTASNEFIYIIHDIFFQVLEYCRKAYRLIGRRVLKKNVLVDKVQNWSMESEIRNFELTQKAVRYAIDEGYLQNISIGELKYSEIKRLIHIYWIMRRAFNEKNQ